MRMGRSFGEKPSIVNKDEPRINTNRHEYGWTSLINEPFAKFGSGTFIGIGHKRHKITACDFCAFCGQGAFLAMSHPILKRQNLRFAGMMTCPATIFAKSSSILVFIRVHSWFVGPFRGCRSQITPQWVSGELFPLPSAGQPRPQNHAAGGKCKGQQSADLASAQPLRDR